MRGPSLHASRRALADVFGSADPVARALGNQTTTQRGRVYSLTPSGGERLNFIAGSRADRLVPLAEAGLRFFKGHAERFSIILCSPAPQPVRLPGWMVDAQQTVYRMPRTWRAPAAMALQPVSDADGLQAWLALVERSFASAAPEAQAPPPPPSPMPGYHRYFAINTADDSSPCVGAAGIYRTASAQVIADFCIDPAHRGRGHGHRLLAALRAHQREQRDTPLYALASPLSSAFYARAGWVPAAFVQRLRCVSRLPMF